METKNNTSKNLGREISIKVLILLGIVLLLQIPIFMVQNLIETRERNERTVYRELTENWGGSATVSSPYLYNPLPERNSKDDEDKKEKDDLIAFTPSKLTITTDIEPKELKRGIFQIPVFTAKIQMDIEFSAQTKHFKEFINNSKEQQKDICLFVPIDDFRQQGSVFATLNGTELLPVISRYSHITIRNFRLDRGLEFCINPELIKNSDSLKYTVKFTALGSESISFMSFADETTVKASSPWASPSFFGDILPMARNVTAEGFEAEWHKTEIDEGVNFTPDTFGVKFITPVDHYRLTERSTKYALLFIALTFLSFFIAETVGKWRIHPIQYLLVGVAMVLFYSLLLSFTEQLGFTAAYIISSIGTVLLISGYTFTIMRNKQSSYLISSLLIILYVFLYVILRMEEFSLMAGSIFLFIALGATMFVLRNVNWYDEREKK